MFVWVLLIGLCTTTQSWNVLFVTVFGSGSHQTVSGPLANLLLSHNHTVTYMSTNIPKYVSNKAEKLTIPHCESLVNDHGSGRNKTDDSFIKSVRKTLGKIDATLSSCDRFWGEPNVQILKTSVRKYDLLLTFAPYYDVCALGLAHILGIQNAVLHVTAPYILPLHLSRLGLPLYASSTKIDDILLKGKDHGLVKGSMWTRFANVLQRNLMTVLHKAAVNWYIEPVLYSHVPDYPGYKETYKTVKLILMNIHHHPVVDGPTPFGPGVLTLGGSMCTDYNSAEVDNYPGLANFINNATEGFIFMSFGSLQMDIPAEEQNKWLEVFASLPYKVVWKQNKGPQTPDNVMLFSWLPQQSLLQHPNLKLFITHGGHSSKMETACAGKPMLVVPQFAKDQFYNAVRAAETGVGDNVLDLQGTSAREIMEKIINATDGRFQKNLNRVRRQIMSTKLTNENILGHLDAVVSGYNFLPGYQPWYELYHLDMLVPPTLLVLGLLGVKRYRNS